MRDIFSVIKKRATEGIRALGDNAHAVFNADLKGKATVEQEEWMIEKLEERRKSGEQQSLPASFCIVIKLKNSRNKS